MPLESASFISQLDSANPLGTEPKSVADDHLRLIKNVLKTQFPNFGAAALVPTAQAINQFHAAASADSSGNLGVGVAPSIFRCEFFKSSGGAAQVGITSANNSFSELYFGDTDNKTAGALSYSHSDDSLSVFTGASARMRIDSIGNLVQQAPSSPPSLTTNGQLVMNLTSSTNLRISVRGADGVTRVANLPLA